MQMIISIIVNSVVGAAVGYLTNDIALKAMFQGFPPFVAPRIAKDKASLGESLGETIAARLLPDEAKEAENALLHRLQEDEVKDALSFAIEDWFANSLPDIIKDLHFDEIEGFEQTIVNIQKLADQFLRQNTLRFVDKLVKEIDLSVLLPDEQQTFLLDQVLSMLSAELKSNSLEPYLELLLEDNAESCLADILGSRTDEIAFRLSKECAAHLIQSVCARPEALIELLTRLDFERALTAALQEIADKPLSVLLGNKTIAEFIEKNRAVMKSVTASEDFRNVLTVFIRETIQLLSEVDISLYQIFPINEQNKLSDYISKKLPEFTPYLRSYLEEKRGKIADMIDGAIDSVIDADTSNQFANQFRKWLHDPIQSEVGKVDIINQIDQLADGFLQSDNAVEALRDLLGGFLKDTKASDIIAYLKSRNALDEKNLEQALFHFIHQYIDHVPEDLYKFLGALRPGDWIDIRALPLSQWKTRLATWCAARLLDSPAFRSKAETVCAKALYGKVNQLLQTSIGKLFTADMRARLKENAAHIPLALSRQKPTLIRRIKSWAATRIQDQKVHGLLSQSAIKQLAHLLSLRAREKLHRFAGIHRKDKIATVIRQLSQCGRKLSTILQNAITSLLQKQRGHAKSLLKQIVTDRIRDLDTKQVGKMMSNFMGKEMRPLCRMGAVMGALIGIALGIGDIFCGDPVSPLSWAVRFLMFAAIGIITNKLAFEGLFRPYEEKSGSVWRFWKQGYIPANKKTVAYQFGSLVTKELLNRETVAKCMDQIYEENGEAFKKSILQEDCRALRQILQKNHGKIAEQLSLWSVDFLEQHADSLFDHLVQMLKKLHINDLIPPDALPNAAVSLLRKGQAHAETIGAWLSKMMRTDQSLQQISPALSDWIQKEIAKETEAMLRDKLKAYLNYPAIFQLAKKHDPYPRYKDKTLREIIRAAAPPNPLPQAAHELSALLLDSLFSTRGGNFISNTIAGLLDRELDQKTVGNVFDGQLRRLIDGGILSITNSLVTSILKKLQASKRTVQDELIQKTHAQVNIAVRAVIDADNLIKNVVTRLLDQDLSDFFRKEIRNLSDMLRDFCEQRVYTIQLSAIQLDLKQLNFTVLVQDVLSNQRFRQRLQAPAASCVKTVLDAIANQKLSVFANILQIDSLTDLIGRFEPQAKDVICNVTDTLCNNDNFISSACTYVYQTVDRAVLQTRMKELMHPISDIALQETAENAVSFILTQRAAEQYLQVLFRDAYHNYGREPLADQLDLTAAKASIHAVLSNKPLLRPILSEQCDLAIRALVTSRMRCIAPSTQDQLMDWLMCSVFKTLSAHLQSLLEAVKLDQIVEQIVLGMDGQSIHKMFLEFAKRYFRELIAMGGIGGSIVFIEWGLLKCPLFPSLACADLTILLTLPICLFVAFCCRRIHRKLRNRVK